MIKTHKNIIISEGNRPLWQLIIAAIHYTAIISLLFFFFADFEFSLETKKLKRSIHLFQFALFLLPSALAFSMVRNVLFDLENLKYKIEYCVGPVRYGKWKVLPKIEYVSVFKQPLADGNFIFEANLWYSSNRHFNIYSSDSLEPAFEMGYRVAKVLSVDLLDASVPNNNRWVDIKKQP